MSGFIGTSKPFEKFGKTAENYLARKYPSIVDNRIDGIHIGRNKDSTVGGREKFRVTGSHVQEGAPYLEVPNKILGLEKIKNVSEAGLETFTNRVTDSAKEWATSEFLRLRDDAGMDEAKAKAKVQDTLNSKLVSYFDVAARKYVAEPLVGRVRDSILSGLAVPYWDVSFSNKVFKQPFIAGMGRNLVDVIGVPNIWAEVLTMYAESFEGYARLSDTAKGNVEFNTSAPARAKFDQLVSNFVNIVIDYEQGYNAQLISGKPGNFLTGMAFNDTDRYSRLMLEQLKSALWLFGAPEADFDGLMQLTTVDTYAGTPLQDIWAGTSATKGADCVNALLQLIGDTLESLSFMPANVRINVSPTVYKVLTFVLMSDVYNSKSPITVLRERYSEDSEGIVVSNGFGKGPEKFVLVSDPFCAADTPWNDDPTSDIMFMTIPTVKSALEEQTSLVMAPVAIENYVLPSFPNRDGTMRTMLSRVGSLIAPVTGTVKILRGFGVQP